MATVYKMRNNQSRVTFFLKNMTCKKKERKKECFRKHELYTPFSGSYTLIKKNIFPF